MRVGDAPRAKSPGARLLFAAWYCFWQKKPLSLLPFNVCWMADGGRKGMWGEADE
jgi:hypothetical protein